MRYLEPRFQAARAATILLVVVGIASLTQGLLRDLRSFLAGDMSRAYIIALAVVCVAVVLFTAYYWLMKAGPDRMLIKELNHACVTAISVSEGGIAVIPNRDNESITVSHEDDGFLRLTVVDTTGVPVDLKLTRRNLEDRNNYIDAISIPRETVRSMISLIQAYSTDFGAEGIVADITKARDERISTLKNDVVIVESARVS